MSLSGQGSSEVPGPSVPGRVRSAPSLQMSFWTSSGENEVSLARRASRSDFLEVSLQLLDPSEWTLVAHGGFLREENVKVD